jgi:hypothetical protein
MARDASCQSSQSRRSEYHKTASVEDMTERNVQTIVQLEGAARANRSGSDRPRRKISRPQLEVTNVADAIHLTAYEIDSCRVVKIKSGYCSAREFAEELGPMTFVFSNASCADGRMVALSTRSIKCNTRRSDSGSSEATQSVGMTI